MQVRRLFKLIATTGLVLGLFASPSLQAGEGAPVTPNPCKVSSGLSSPLVTGLYVSSVIF